MTTKLKGDGSLFLTEQAAAAADVAGDGQLWVETATPNILKFTDDAGTDFNIATENKALTTLATEQATTSGTSIDFTGIPSGVKEIAVNLVGVSTNGTSRLIVQIGDSGGIETSGYLGAALDNALSVSYTDGFGVLGATAASVRNGSLILTLENSSSFTWAGAGCYGRSDAAAAGSYGGSKSLSAELTQLRLTTQGGSDTFDAGAINIKYSF